MPPSPTSAPNLLKFLPTPCPSDADAHRFMAPPMTATMAATFAKGQMMVRCAAQMGLSISLASTLPTFVAISPTKKCRTSDHGDRLTSSRNAGTWVFAEAAHDPDALQDSDAAEGADDSLDDTTGDYEPVFQPRNSNGMTLALSLTRLNYLPHQQFNRHSLQQHLQQQLP